MKFRDIIDGEVEDNDVWLNLQYGNDKNVGQINLVTTWHPDPPAEEVKETEVDTDMQLSTKLETETETDAEPAATPRDTR